LLSASVIPPYRKRNDKLSDTLDSFSAFTICFREEVIPPARGGIYSLLFSEGQSHQALWIEDKEAPETPLTNAYNT
jgi:hypothetical protein